MSPKTSKGIFKFNNIARIIGFIVDIITLVSILFTVKLSDQGISIPTFITPWFALGLWIISIYLYFAFLRTHWGKNKKEKGDKYKFVLYLWQNLIMGFQKPFILLPLLILYLLGFWIFYSIESVLGVIIFIFIQFFIVLTLITYVESKKYTLLGVDYEPTEEQKALIEENWSLIKKIIKTKLPEFMWLSEDQFKEIFLISNITQESMKYAFAKFVVENPQSTAYGDVWAKDGPGLIPTESDVLINLDIFNFEDYYYR